VGLNSLKSLNLTNGYPNKNKNNKNKNKNNKVKSKPLELRSRVKKILKKIDKKFNLLSSTELHKPHIIGLYKFETLKLLYCCYFVKKNFVRILSNFS
jgi:hypothetical protein